ncbi:hypothetical protein U1Q18_046731, partial [Sarracenia purpurea var. burkii]
DTVDSEPRRRARHQVGWREKRQNPAESDGRVVVEKIFVKPLRRRRRSERTPSRSSIELGKVRFGGGLDDAMDTSVFELGDAKCDIIPSKKFSSCSINATRSIRASVSGEEI